MKIVFRLAEKRLLKHPATYYISAICQARALSTQHLNIRWASIYVFVRVYIVFLLCTVGSECMSVVLVRGLVFDRGKSEKFSTLMCTV